MQNRWLRGILPILLIALPVCAQHSTTNDPELRELEQYTLSMDNVTRYTDVIANLGPVIKGHPEYKDSLEIDADKHESLDQITKKIVAAKPIADLIAKHGFTPRQFVLEQFAFIQASMGVAMKPQGESDSAYGQQTHINPANLAFLRTHQEEVGAMMKRAAQE